MNRFLSGSGFEESFCIQQEREMCTARVGESVIFKDNAIHAIGMCFFKYISGVLVVQSSILFVNPISKFYNHMFDSGTLLKVVQLPRIESVRAR